MGPHRARGWLLDAVRRIRSQMVGADGGSELGSAGTGETLAKKVKTTDVVDRLRLWSALCERVE